MDALFGRRPDDLPPSLLSAIALLQPECPPEAADEIIACDAGLFDTAREEMVASLIVDRWGERLSERLSAEAFDRWQNLRYSSLAVPAQRRPETLKVLAGLAEAGVPAIVMRGFWLAEAVYERPGQRPYADVDIIAPFEQLALIVGVMEAHGLALAPSSRLPVPAKIREDLRRGIYEGGAAWRKALSGLNRIEFDLHATLAGVSVGWWPYRPSEKLLSERSEPWPLDGVALRALAPEFALIAHCDNLWRHNLARAGCQSTLIRYYDVLRIAERITEEGWERLVADALELRVGVQMALMLHKVGELWGPRWPPGLPERLGRRTVSGRIARYAAGRPRWLGQNGRIAVFQACATRNPLAAAQYIARNVGPAVREFRRRGREQTPSRQEHKT